jgi:hypothetical protein
MSIGGYRVIGKKKEMGKGEKMERARSLKRGG